MCLKPSIIITSLHLAYLPVFFIQLIEYPFTHVPKPEKKHGSYRSVSPLLCTHYTYHQLCSHIDIIFQMSYTGSLLSSSTFAKANGLDQTFHLSNLDC